MQTRPAGPNVAEQVAGARPMSDVDQLIAAIFATMTVKEQTREGLLEEFEFYARALPARRAAARKAESEKGMETWRK